MCLSMDSDMRKDGYEGHIILQQLNTKMHCTEAHPHGSKRGERQNLNVQSPLCRRAVMILEQ